jgi:hypothetical protein
MSVQVIGADVVAAKFERALEAMRSEKKVWMGEAGEICEKTIAANIQKQGLVYTGALLYSGRVVGVTGSTAYVGFGAGVVGEDGTPYAEFLENGTTRHPITGNPLLSFYWVNRGGFIGPSVSHPGNKPYRFMWRGAQESLIPIALMLKSRINAILAAF